MADLAADFTGFETQAVRELVVISGKGGTGKTSVMASLAGLADGAVLADCDVDAADLALVLSPTLQEEHPFTSGHEAIIRPEDCVACGTCLEVCRFDSIRDPGDGEPYVIDAHACEGCGVCVRFCPAAAIDFPERLCGRWMVSQTRCGPMVHAELGIGAENSGKLVFAVRRRARELAASREHAVLLCDGPPGIGCPVIASITGASMVLVVTEPTVAGEHDLDRVLALTGHFKISTGVCVNRWDINAEMTERLEEQARRHGAWIAGRIRYDPGVTQAQLDGQAVVETTAPAAEDLRRLWGTVQTRLIQGPCSEAARA